MSSANCSLELLSWILVVFQEVLDTWHKFLLSSECDAEAAALGASATLLPGHSTEVAAFDAGGDRGSLERANCAFVLRGNEKHFSTSKTCKNNG